MGRAFVVLLLAIIIKVFSWECARAAGGSRVAMEDKIVKKFSEIVAEKGVHRGAQEIGKIVYQQQVGFYLGLPHELIGDIIQKRYQGAEEEFVRLKARQEDRALDNSDSLAVSMWPGASSLTTEIQDIFLSKATEVEKSNYVKESLSRSSMKLDKLGSIDSMPAASVVDKEKKREAFAVYRAELMQENVQGYVNLVESFSDTLFTQSQLRTENVIKSLYLEQLSSLSLDKLLTLLEPEQQVLDYFAYVIEHRVEMLEGGSGISAEEAAEALGISTVVLKKTVGRLQKELKSDSKHFIHRIEIVKLEHDGKKVTHYRLAATQQPKPNFLVKLAAGVRKNFGTDTEQPDLSLRDKRILLYFENNMDSLQDESGIPVVEMAKALNISSFLLRDRVLRLQQKLKHDDKHFIHRIDYQELHLNSKPLMYYRLLEPGESTLNSEETKKILSYFENNMDLLQEGGIPVAKIAKNLGISPVSLGWRIHELKKKLGKEHFIHSAFLVSASKSR